MTNKSNRNTGSASFTRLTIAQVQDDLLHQESIQKKEMAHGMKSISIGVQRVGALKDISDPLTRAQTMQDTLNMAE